MVGTHADMKLFQKIFGKIKSTSINIGIKKFIICIKIIIKFMKIDNLRYSIKKILKNKNFKNNDPNWNDIISKHKKTYNELKEKASKGQKILICTSTGGHLLSSHFEALLALTLTRYGANVEIMLCDKVLTACQMSTTQFISEKFNK